VQSFNTICENIFHLSYFSACLWFLQAWHELRIPNGRRPPLHPVLLPRPRQVLPVVSKEGRKCVLKPEAGDLGWFRRCSFPHSILQTRSEISGKVMTRSNVITFSVTKAAVKLYKVVQPGNFFQASLIFVVMVMPSWWDVIRIVLLNTSALAKH